MATVDIRPHSVQYQKAIRDNKSVFLYLNIDISVFFFSSSFAELEKLYRLT